MDDQIRLFHAVKNDDLETIKSLCSDDKVVGKGETVDLNVIDEEYGYTPLGAAVMFGYIDIVTYLCQLPSVDVNAADNNGSTPLCVAAREGHTTIAKHLCAIEGVEVNKTDNWGDSPLIIAALLGQITTLKVLASAKGINLNLVNKKRGTPLCTAARNGNEEVVQYLCKLEDLDVNLAGANDNTPLFLASVYARYRTLEFLVHEERVDVNYKCSLDGDTALHCAARRGKVKTAEILLQRKNIDLQIRNNRGQTPLDIAAQNIDRFSIALMLACKIQNVNINKQYKDGNTLLHMAVITENEDAKLHICSIPEARNVKDKTGKTPFDLAAESKTCPLSFLLCLYKLPGAEEVDINRRYRENKTLLHIAVEEQNRSSLESIYSTNGVELSATDINGNTALHYAALDKNRSFFELIVNKEGVDLTKENNEGLTPLDILSQDEENYPLILESAMRLQGDSMITNKRFHNGNTLFHMAVHCENQTAMSDMTKLGRAESIENNQGHTPFDLAALSKNNELLMHFYEQGEAEYWMKHKPHSTSLEILSAEEKNYHIVLKLAHKFPTMNVNNNCKFTNGNTLLHMAVISKNDEELKYLCNLQGTTNIKNDQGKTPFDLASESGPLRYLLYLYSLSGAELGNINQAFRGRKTLLHLAVEEKNLEAIKKLSSTDGIRNYRDLNGDTPFDKAVNDDECPQSFLLYLYRCPGVQLTNINAWLRDGKNLLHIAVEENKNDFVTFLFESSSNIDVNVRDSKELSVVHHAVLNNKLDTLKMLCTHKAIDLNLQVNGKMPLEMAIDRRYFEIVSFLLSQETIDIHIDNDKDRNMVFNILGSVVKEKRRCIELSEEVQANLLDTLLDNYLTSTNLSFKFIPSLRRLMEYDNPPLLSYLGRHKEDIRLTEDLRIICSAIYNVIVKGLQQYVNHKELRYVLLKKHVIKLSIKNLIYHKRDNTDYVIELLKIVYFCLQVNNICTDDRKAFLGELFKDSHELGRFKERLEKIAMVGKVEIEGADSSDARLIANNILATYFGEGSSCCSSLCTRPKKAYKRFVRRLGITNIFHECTVRKFYSVVPCLVFIGVHISDFNSDAVVGYQTLHGFSYTLGSFMIGLVVISVIHENVRSHITFYDEEKHYLTHFLGRAELTAEDWHTCSNLHIYYKHPWIVRQILKFFWPFKVREPKGPHSDGHFSRFRSFTFNMLSIMMLRPAIFRLAVLTHSPINIRHLYRQQAQDICHSQYHMILEQIPELIIQFYLIQIYFNNIGKTGLTPTCLTNSTHNFDYKNGNFGCTDNLLGNTESCISMIELYSVIIPFFRIPSLMVSVEESLRKLSPITPKMSTAATSCLYFGYLMMVPARLFLFAAIMHSVSDNRVVVYLIMVCGASFIRNCIIVTKHESCLQRVKGTLKRLKLKEILSLILFSIRDVFVISLREPMAYTTRPSKVTYHSLRSWKTLMVIFLFYFVEGLVGAIYIEYHYPCGVRSSYFLYQGWLYLALLIYSVTVMTMLSYTLHPKRIYILHQKFKKQSLVFFGSGLLLLFAASAVFLALGKEPRKLPEKIAMMTIIVLITSALIATVIILKRFGEASKKTTNTQTSDGTRASATRTRSRGLLSFSTCTSACEVVISEPKLKEADLEVARKRGNSDNGCADSIC